MIRSKRGGKRGEVARLARMGGSERGEQSARSANSLRCVSNLRRRSVRSIKRKRSESNARS